MWFSYKQSWLFPLPKRVDFDVIVDHLACNHIIKSKAGPATARIRRFLELISSYSFNLYYLKGKDMMLGDFLLRKNHDNSNPHKMIPIFFNMHNLLHGKYYNIGKREKYLVQMQSQTKSSGVNLPEVHGVSKNFDPNILPEKQNIRPIKGNKILQEKPQIGQGRAGMRRRLPPINQAITETSELSKKIPEVSNIEMKITNQADVTTPAQSITNSNAEVTHRRPLIKDIPFYQDPTYRPLPKPVRTLMSGSSESSESLESTDINPEINNDFKENSPFQEGVISELYHRPDKLFFQEPWELEGLVTKGNLIQEIFYKTGWYW